VALIEEGGLLLTHAEQSDRFVRAVEPASVVDQVTKEIRRSILSGSLKPGQQFSLREISAQLGISFIPVREALRQLDAQGLVITRPGKSACVAPLSHEDLRGIYRLRRQIEPEIGARSCKLLDETDYTRLARYVDMFGDDDLGIDDVYEAHHQFHLELLRPAATAWDLRVLQGLWHAAERYIRLAFLQLDVEPREHHRRQHAHAALLETFRLGDPERVSLAVLHHLDDNEILAQKALDPVVED
jgi:DNA-binding GntR family transcriptional regulator